MKAVAYARYSSDNQRQESIDAQVRAIKDYCQKNDCTLLHVYKDEAISGTSDDRPAFLQMIADSKKREFDTVIVHKLDRFSRNRYDSATYKMALKRNGVVVLSVLENIEDTPEGAILESVLEGMNEYYSRNLSREVKKGQKENALKCVHNGGTPPLGYDVDPTTHKLVINTVEAEAVKLIFDMTAEDKSYSEIISAMNAKGFRTKRNGNEFGKNSIHKILRNKKYIGIYEFGKINRTRVNTMDAKSSCTKSKSPIHIEGGCPAIIDRKTWDIVQEKMNRRKSSPKATVGYKLRGKLYCGICGAPYVGSSMKSHGEKDYYYVCSGKKNKNGCTNRNIRKDVLETELNKYLWDNVLNADADVKLIAMVNEYNQHVKENLKSADNKAIVSGIEKLHRQLERTKQAYYAELIPIEELKSEKTRIESEIATFQDLLADKQPIPLTPRKIKEFFQYFKSNFFRDEAILNHIVDKVTISNDEVTVNLFSHYRQG